MTTAEIGAIIACLGLILSIATYAAGRQSAIKKEGKEAGSIQKDIEYIKGSIDRIDNRLNDDVKRLEGRTDELSKQLINIAGTASKAYESSKMEHNRLNEHLERDHGQTLIKGRKNEEE